MGAAQIKKELDLYIKEGNEKLLKLLHAVAKEYILKMISLYQESL
jgi:hypothetical protein